MAASAVNTFRLLQTFHGIQGGRYDPSTQATNGNAGTIFVQLPPFGATSPFGLWQKQDNGTTTNWTEISSSNTGITDYKNPVRLASTANIALSGGAALVVDGVATVNGDRILLKDQAAPAENGIYTVSGIGTAYALTRSTDANHSAEVTQGMFTWAMFGTVNAETGWILTTPNPIVLGTTALSFTQIPIAGSLSVGAIDSQPKAVDGAVIVAGVLYLQTADSGFPGLLSLGNQNILGVKAFSDPIEFFAQAVPPPIASGGTNWAYCDAADELLKYVNDTGDVRIVNGIVQDEGVPVVSAPQFINFVGAGVSAAINGLGVDVTIPGAGAAATWARETTVLAAPDIVNGYIDLVNTAIDDSVMATPQGSGPLIGGSIAAGDDFEMSIVGPITRVTFSAAVVAAWVVGQRVQIQYQF